MPIDLKAAREVCEMASPAPWDAIVMTLRDAIECGDFEWVGMYTPPRRPDGSTWSLDTDVALVGHGNGGVTGLPGILEVDAGTGRFIAYARTALPAALDEIEKLRADFTAATAITAKNVDEAAAKIEAATSLDYTAKLKGEIAQLRALLKEAAGYLQDISDFYGNRRETEFFARIDAALGGKS